MNRISSQQKKLVSLVLIILLLAPIVYLGAPGDGTENSGGLLAQKRSEYDLGETSLGDVDPTGATMNLVLLGLRGIASNLLWQQAVEQKDHKDWAGLKATVDSIVLLQPHFKQVWQFQAWNLAYNVSAEWDGVVDRYHWVKEGGKFIIKGSNRNKKYPELYWDSGRIIGHKIGAADEKKTFRKFFLNDPEIEGGGPDLDLNPNARDNFLVAKDWFIIANEVEAQPGITQTRLAPVLFRSYPVRSQMDFAEARQDEGKFDEVTRGAWDLAYKEVTTVWGAERFASPAGRIVLEATDDVLKQLVKEDNNKYTLEEKKAWVERRQNMCGYRSWRMRCLIEKKPETIEAHKNIYEGKRDYFSGEDRSAVEKKLFAGMEGMEKLLAEFPELEINDDFREECLKAVTLWQAIRVDSIDGKGIPTNYPLKYLWSEYSEEAKRYAELLRSQF